LFFFSSRRRHTRFSRDWSSDVCSSDLFRRQHIIDNYIVDFVCLSRRVIVEIDGGYHNNSEVKEKDKERDGYLKDCGYAVLRFTNEEVLNNLDAVLEKIIYTLKKPPLGVWGQADFIAEGVEIGRASCREAGEVVGVVG